jgi:VanZ family protein
LNSLDDRNSTHRLLLCAWVVLIFFSSTGVAGRWANALYAILSSHSGLGEGVTMFLFQKAYHVFLFAVLGALLVSGASRSPAFSRVVLWSFLIGSLSEALQLLFANRGPSLRDVLLNGVSGLLGAWIWLRASAGRRRPTPTTVPWTPGAEAIADPDRRGRPAAPNSPP